MTPLDVSTRAARPATRGAFGIDPLYVRARDAVRDASLLRLVAGSDLALDRTGVLSALGAGPPSARTCFTGVRAVAVARAQASETRMPVEGLDVEAALRAALARALDAHPRAAVALSGGLDSALLLALAREQHGSCGAITLHTPFRGYDETAAARATARALGVELLEVRADELAFRRALPEAVRRAEAPFFNLHPVGRVLLADGARALGFDALITGDGADQVFCARGVHNWFPMARTLIERGGVAHLAPFLADAVRACAPQSIVPDPHKRVLRDLAQRLGVPAAIARAPKTPRYTPPLQLDDLVDARARGRLADRLRVQLRIDVADVARADAAAEGIGDTDTRLVTLALLLRAAARA